MKRTREQRHRDFWWGCLIVALTIVILCIASCVKNAAFIEAQSGETTTEAVPTVYIVYTEEASRPYAALTYPHLLERAKPQFALTDAERDRIARIVAGQAADRTTTCQTMVAQVMYNQMLTTGGNISKTEYAKCAGRTPTAETYEAVDAIFQRGEWLLDDTVLWTGSADKPDEWHQTLRLVTTQEGIAFYEVA